MCVYIRTLGALTREAKFKQDVKTRSRHSGEDVIYSMGGLIRTQNVCTYIGTYAYVHTQTQTPPPPPPPPPTHTHTQIHRYRTDIRVLQDQEVRQRSRKKGPIEPRACRVHVLAARAKHLIAKKKSQKNWGEKGETVSGLNQCQHCLEQLIFF